MIYLNHNQSETSLVESLYTQQQQQFGPARTAATSKGSRLQPRAGHGARGSQSQWRVRVSQGAALVEAKRFLDGRSSASRPATPAAAPRGPTPAPRGATTPRSVARRNTRGGAGRRRVLLHSTVVPKRVRSHIRMRSWRCCCCCCWCRRMSAPRKPAANGAWGSPHRWPAPATGGRGTTSPPSARRSLAWGEAWRRVHRVVHTCAGLDMGGRGGRGCGMS